MKLVKQSMLILSCIGLIIACEKQDDYSRLSYNYQYRADISFAIGSSYLNLPVLGVNLPMGWEDNPSLLSIPDSLILEDNLPFEPQSWITQGAEKISHIVIKVRGYNEFPDRVQLTFSLADTLNYSIFPDDSLATLLVPEATFTEDTFPKEKGVFETYITLSNNQLKNIANKKYFHIKAVIQNQTKHPGHYAYYPYLKIEIGTGVQAQFDFNLQTLKNQ